MSGRLYWDYGDGFNDLDYIEMKFIPEKNPKGEPLGNITIEASGLRNEQSRGDMVWLVLTRYDFEAGEYVVEGKHEWMHWVTIKAHKKGRQLALFPGAKITLTNTQAAANLKFFKTPDSGIARISSERGPVRFFDGYGRNKQFAVSTFRYRDDVAGTIGFVTDPHRRKKLTHISLPHQKIAGLKFEPVKEDLITGIDPIEKLLIRRLGDRTEEGPARINSIKVNGKQIDDVSFATRINVPLVKNQYVFDDPAHFIQVNGPLNSFEIEYLPIKGTMPFQIVIDGSLYQPAKAEQNSGSDTVQVIRKEADINYQGLRLESLEIKDVAGESHNYSVENTDKRTYVIDNLAGVKQRQFRWLLFSVQLGTAAFLSLVLYWLMSLAPFTESRSLKGLALNIFFRRGRWLFWLLFFCGVTVNVLWLLAEWPGCLTPDSVHVHSGIKQLQITNHHPYLYSLIILGLYNIYDAPLSVILFQITAYNGLIAAFMYVLFRKDIRWWVLLPLCCTTFFLIPVNVYNLTLWKDIPFTILVLFWAFFITVCYYQKRYSDTPVRLSGIELILLAILFVSLCTLRHNGIVYMAFIPVCLLFFSNISRIWLLKFAGLSTMLFLLYYIVIPPFVLYERPERNDWAKNKLSKTVKRAERITGDEGFYLEHYLGDRVTRFTASLGVSPKATTWYNDMNTPPQRWFSVDQLRAEFKTAPKSQVLNDLKNRLLQTRSFTGYSGGRFIHWNSLFSLTALIALFMLYRWFPVSALYSSFFLYQTAALFFVVWARWRYMYFLYLGGVFLLFIILLELSGKRKLRKKQLQAG